MVETVQVSSIEVHISKVIKFGSSIKIQMLGWDQLKLYTIELIRYGCIEMEIYKNLQGVQLNCMS